MTQEAYVCNVDNATTPDVVRLAKNMNTYADAMQEEGRTDEADELRRHASDLLAPSQPTGNDADVDTTPPVMPTLSAAK